MGLFETIFQRLFPFTPPAPVEEKSPKVFATPAPPKSPLMANFSLPSSKRSSVSPSRVLSFPLSTSSSSSSYWLTPRASRSPSKWSPRKYVPPVVRNTKKQTAVVVCLVLALLLWVVPLPRWGHKRVIHVNLQQSLDVPYRALLPGLITDLTDAPDPQQWLAQNSGDKHSLEEKPGLVGYVTNWKASSRKPRAALISLVRNSELEGMLQSMRSLELHWNRKYRYPWVFFNDEPFSDEFKQQTQSLTLAKCYYEVVPREHWSLPDWIDEDRFMNSLEYLGAIGVGKGWMISYRHMCRWNSGFFYKHPRLQDFDWYWRVEPDVHFFCDITYDVFRFMAENKLKYGFNMNILDDARSFPSLWSRTRAFINSHPDLVHPEADLDWLLDPHNSGDYNNCQFFSNFEVGSLDFFRGEANERYFEWLDKGGGFYYERFGDAPIHTLSVAMFVPKREIWFFRDIGYQHDVNRQCPPNSSAACSCEPTPLDENFYKLVPMESPQKKPDDTCIRQFLGGQWLEKKANWSQEDERSLGGDGYGGYVYSGVD